MTRGQEAAIDHLTAAAANFETEIMRRVADPGARAAVLRTLTDVLHSAIAGTARTDVKR